MKRIFGALALGAAVSSPLAAQDLSNPDSDFVDTTSKKAWHAVVERTERGYLIGNPDAEAQLIIFTSYACEGCHAFAFKGDPELDYALLAPGLMSVEIRLRINHPIDVPLSLLSQCGAPRKFKVNHAMFMRDQSRWRERWQSASAYNRSIWSRSTAAARSGMVSGLDFDDMMARQRGYSRMDLNRCLTDRKALQRLRANAAADSVEFDLPSNEAGHAVPHFVLNGQKLSGVNSWDDLYPVLSEAFKPEPEAE